MLAKYKNNKVWIFLCIIVCFNMHVYGFAANQNQCLSKTGNKQIEKVNLFINQNTIKKSISLFVFNTKKLLSSGMSIIKNEGLTDETGGIFVFPNHISNISISTQGLGYLLDILLVNDQEHIIRIEQPEKNGLVKISPSDVRYVLVFKRGTVDAHNLNLDQKINLARGVSFLSEQEDIELKQCNAKKKHLGALTSSYKKASIEIFDEVLDVHMIKVADAKKVLHESVIRNVLDPMQCLMILYPEMNKKCAISIAGLSKFFSDAIIVNEKNIVEGMWRISDNQDFIISNASKVIYLSPGVLESYNFQLGLKLTIKDLK